MPDTKTYRGRSVEELLPKIKAELGPEALILARREGLQGGVGGFFQRSFVELDARGPVEDPQVELRSDRATSEGLSTPGIQALLAQASPFASRLAAAAAEQQQQAAAGLYGPQPALVEPAPEETGFVAGLPSPPAEPAGLVAEPAAAAAAVAVAEPVAVRVPVAAAIAPAPAPVVAEPVAAAPAPAAAPPAAAALGAALERAGLPAALAAEVVGEAVVHGIPFASPRALKSLVRTALARRVPTMAPLGGGPRTVAVVGAAGAGKSTAAARLAAAYRDAGMPVRELAAGDPVAREPFAGLTVIDAPATGVRDAARAAEVAQALDGLGAEVHLALPATMSGPAAADLTAALAPLRPTHLLLTFADETSHPGAAVAHAVASGLPLSYESGAESISPADAAELARRLVK